MGSLVSSLRWQAFESFFSLSRAGSLFASSTLKLSSFPAPATVAATYLKSAAPPPQQKHVVIIGGAYAGLSTLINIQKLLSGEPHVASPYSPPALSSLPRTPPKITILDERDGVVHTVGTPLVHTSPNYAKTTQHFWKKYEDIPYLRGVEVLQGRVESVHPDRKELLYVPADSDGEKGKSLAYDYLVCATGLKRAWPVQPRTTKKEEFVRDTKKLVEELIDAKDSVVVVGGGAVGTEFAAELKLTQPEKRVILIHSRNVLLSTEPLPDEFKAKALELLEEAGVEVMLNTRVLDESAGELQLSTGATLKASHVLWCVGRQHPSTTYLPAAALDAKSGLVAVSSTLNFPSSVANSNAHYAVGDIARWSGIKRVGSALLMGSFAARNLVQSMVAEENNEEPKLAEFPEIPPMLVLALGKKAVGYHQAMGFTFGEEPLKQSFGDDLGLSICWGCLNLEVDGTATQTGEN
ncbi:oxidoreductase [Sphaerosporella brunnea]|uniref:Oxidoreductase n=1 Tax=Sphaerosporella brunnea TaxID=1250544 RepID=A0A5J5EWG4_9PEZI|nr:oxidoreductase [Sphaerosporella brunnea]